MNISQSPLVFCHKLYREWNIQGILVRLETVAVDIDEDGIVEGCGMLSAPHRAHDIADQLSSMTGEDDEMSVLREFNLHVVCELQGIFAEHVRMRVTAERQVVVSPSVDQHDDRVDVEPVRTLHFDRGGDFL